jgi:hypothetical protein
MLSTQLCLGIPIGLLHSGSPVKTLHATLFYAIRATCTSHLRLLYFITRKLFVEGSLLRSPVISFLLGPNILLSNLFLKTLSLHSSLKVIDQVSHTYEIRGKIMVLYIVSFPFFDTKLQDINSAPNDSKYSSTSVCS